jgi:2-keto-3-deoxy-L-rhamnonate aldolase RhmA
MTGARENRLVNPVLERMRSGGIALGMNVRLGRSGDIARIARATGHDFIFIDTQHALFDLETLGHIANVAFACGIAPLVRVRGVGDPDVSLLLDNGAMGIVFPDVSSAAEARLPVCAAGQAFGWRRLHAFRFSRASVAASIGGAG